ncbi:MAG: citrate synthase [Deltaproteobacteria bacterium]|nr:citrate synthase [Deltaproteobacteria bacterium]MCB9489883.1 citrate synthase [Deltaproteobacteria bacterium]
MSDGEQTVTKGEKATLTFDGKQYELPVVVGTENEKAIDISRLRAETGYITLDDGYGNTGACESSITYIDGENGILRYRGYPIEDLARHATFLEVSYLLIYGCLPTQDQLTNFETKLTRHTLVHEHMRRFFDAFPPSAHPMAILSSVVCGLSTFYKESGNTKNDDDVELSIIRILAKLPTIAAMSYKKSLGQPIIYPDNALDYTSNFLQMMFGFPTEKYQVDPDIARTLDVMLTLHADHEQNCSTSTVRLVGSSRANLYAAISSAICALWGPLHGGANQAVLEMLTHMRDSGLSVKSFIDKVKDDSSEQRLMGFGHRVYKNYDPRATIIKEHADLVLTKLKKKDPLLDMAMELEEAALSDDYFISRRLYPNVDFYSGLIYRALDIPTNMFTVIFAMGRLPGWIAQWKEMMFSDSRIGRPRQIYVGAAERQLVPIAKRTEEIC